MSNYQQRNQENIYQNNITTELQKLIKNVWTDNSIILPKSFIELLSNITKENLNEQNDPDEYYEIIINRLYDETCLNTININDINNLNHIHQKEWYKYFKNKISFINDIFYGQYKSEIKCKSCNHILINYEPFITIKLELKDNDLLNCLKLHLSWEHNINFTCENCKNTNISKKRLTLQKLPNTLIFTLKRYNNLLQKNNNHITFPSLFEIDNIKYELTSIINHYGHILESGHYTVYSKHHINNKWYEFNDKNITEININNINKNIIYMLIYNKL